MEAQDAGITSQREEWNRVAAGWQKWDSWLDQCYKQFDQKLMDQAEITEGNFVVDLGSGSGFPSLHIAERIGRTGFVAGLDFSEQMVEVARAKAAERKLTNVGFRIADMTKILIADAQLDAVVSRFALMFAPDPEKTLSEILRVLKRGKKFAAAVWGPPEKNPLPMLVLKSFLDLPAPDPSLPGAYRFAQSGYLSGMMEKCGFTDISEEEVQIEESFASGKEYADHVLERSAPIQPLLRQLGEEKRREAAEKLAAAAEQYRKGDMVILHRVAWMVAGRRPGKK